MRREVSDTSWHDECHRLRAEGLSFIKIGMRLGVSADRVAYVLDENGYRARKTAAVKRHRGSWHCGVRHTASAKPSPVQRETISKEDKDAACLAFARGHIDRHELMRRITPRDKWRGRSWFQGGAAE
jgi:hypothetical protein